GDLVRVVGIVGPGRAVDEELVEDLLVVRDLDRGGPLGPLLRHRDAGVPRARREIAADLDGGLGAGGVRKEVVAALQRVVALRREDAALTARARRAGAAARAHEAAVAGIVAA